MPTQLLVHFYRSTIESILCHCITVWYFSCIAENRRVLIQTVKLPRGSLEPNSTSNNKYISHLYLHFSTIIVSKKHTSTHLTLINKALSIRWVRLDTSLRSLDEIVFLVGWLAAQCPSVLNLNPVYHQQATIWRESRGLTRSKSGDSGVTQKWYIGETNIWLFQKNTDNYKS